MNTTTLESTDTVSTVRPAENGTRFWRWWWLGLVLASTPMLEPYFIWNWQFEQYHFFPLVLVAVCVLAYSRFDGVFRAPDKWYSWSAIALGILAIAGSLALATPWLSAVAFVLIVSALLATLQNLQGATLIGLSLPLWLLIRLPLGYDQLLVIRLQTITTELSSVLLDVLRIPHAVSGNIIQLTGRELFVAEACSGIQSVFTLAFVACVLVALYQRPPFLTPFYLLVSCGLAVAANVLRVSAVAAGEAWYSVDLANGWPHEVVGYLALGLGIGLLFSFDQLLVTLIHPVIEAKEIGEFNPLVTTWNWLATSSADREPNAVEATVPIEAHPSFWKRISTGLYWGGVATAIVLFVASVVIAFRLEQRDGQLLGVVVAKDAVFEPQPKLFDDAFETLTIKAHEKVRDGANPRLGENADVWTCDLEGLPAQLVLSQTYSDWHEFCFCYEINGWQLLNREVERTGFNDAKTPMAVALFNSERGQWGHLLYAGVTADGRVVEPPTMAGRLASRFFDNADEQLAANSQILMLQLWITSGKKLEPRLYSRVKADFSKAKDIVVGELGRKLVQ